MFSTPRPPYTYPYSHKIVRDLAWVIGGEPLLSTLPQDVGFDLLKADVFHQAAKRMQPLLQKLEDDPEPLADFIETGNTAIIGKYFERLVEFWFRHDPAIELCAANLQVEKQGRTLGEFDFLARWNGRLLHIEAAGKFYLSEKNVPRWETLTGPNGLDRLSTKMMKIITHQSRLAESDEGRETLRAAGIDESPHPALLLKGYFFYPQQAALDGIATLPEGANENHFRGSWFRASEREQYITPLSYYYVLQRHQWVSGLASAQADELLTGTELLQFLDRYFAANSYPLLIAAVHENEGAWFETGRRFIVDDRWPYVRTG